LRRTKKQQPFQIRCVSSYPTNVTYWRILGGMLAGLAMMFTSSFYLPTPSLFSSLFRWRFAKRWPRPCLSCQRLQRLISAHCAIVLDNGPSLRTGFLRDGIVLLRPSHPPTACSPTTKVKETLCICPCAYIHLTYKFRGYDGLWMLHDIEPCIGAWCSVNNPRKGTHHNIKRVLKQI
jgi:hypothetical protein